MRCPTCDRVVADADAGDGLCCGGVDLRWRCVKCAQLSEGFAFAYGLCPHCSGGLELLDGPRTDEIAAIEGIRAAFEIELGGRAFYQRAAADSVDPVLRALFRRFAVLEGEHMETLSRRHHVDVPGPSPALRIEVAAIYADVENRPQDPDNLFRIAIGLEQRAARFFDARAGKADPDSAERRLYRELADEEREHAETLATEYERWQTGQPGRFERRAPGDAAAAGAASINAAALLLQGHDPQRTALVCTTGETLSFGALRDRVARTAAVWRARGVGPGDRVAIKLADGPDWVVALLGTMWCGAIAVGVNRRVPAADWRYILDEAGFSVILSDTLDDTPAAWREQVLVPGDWHAALAAAVPVEARAMDEEAPAFWCHSSGTSGKPKAVVHAHRFARQIERVSREALGIVPEDRLYATSKLFFPYPQTNSLYAGLKLGATVILDPQWPTAASVAVTVAAQHPTVLLSVPSLYRSLLHEGHAPVIARCGVRLCVSAGEALAPSLRDEWKRQTSLTIVDGYGASETLLLVMLDRGDGHGHGASPGVEIHPLDAVPDGTPTRLCFRAPTLALGYLDRPQAQAENFRDGAFCPADLFVREKNGGWRFAGREDSLVKIRGRWVNLVELEERLSLQTPGIAEAAAVCVPDRDGVDAIALFFVARDAAAAAAALQAGAAAMPPHQRPQWLQAVDSLPRTATGKILRRRLQELHRAQS